ncbi:MAG: M20/M25/M40 family metallo-hydrolase [Ignavibacteria bacterium]|nr:M20/M25/M40 family metallo-hydrolase [Ignavibacteria bacterium]
MFEPEEIKDLFISLAKIEGLSKNERNVNEFIKNFLTNYGLPVFEDNANSIDGGNSGNLICKINGGGDFVLLAHMDTVSSTAQLNPVIENGKITTDGNSILGADNRAGITAILYALKKSIEKNNSLKPFTIAFTICEETTLSGSKNIELDDKIKMGFVFDSHLDPGNFIIKSPGALMFTISVKGKPAHAGIEPEKGINAIECSAKSIARIKQGRIDEETTLNFGKIMGGKATNVVPSLVNIEGEIRSFKIEKVETQFEIVNKIFQEEADKIGCSINIESQWDFKPYRINPESEVYQRINRAIRAIGLEPKEAFSFGGSDANSLNARGIQAVNIGIGAKNPHSNKEYILIEHLIQASKIAYQLMNYE